jgi:hypothetical protein
MISKLKTAARYFYLLMIFILLFSTVNGQKKGKGKYIKNSMFFEISNLKYIGTTSLNLERIVFYSRPFSLTISSGFGGYYTSTISKWHYGFMVPLSLNGFIGEKKNHLEFNLGARYNFGLETDKDISPYYPIINIGYRYQVPRKKGPMYRIFLGSSGFGFSLGSTF